MKTGLIIGAIVILLLLGGAVFLMRSPESTIPTEVTEPIGNEVITDSGEGFVQLAPSDEAAPRFTSEPTRLPVASPAQSAGATTVTFSDAGATPLTMSVAAGTTVQFVNNGQAPRWPASDVHPTHEILPAFDAKRGLQTGENYTFTFVTPGTWRWHDHLHPTVRGTITVTAAE